MMGDLGMQMRKRVLCKQQKCFFSKYVYRVLASMILIIIATIGFVFFWYQFVCEHNQTGNLLGLGNILMAALLYVALFAVLGRWMHAFKIGVERKANLLASQVLTVVVVNILEVFLSCAITGQFRFFLAFAKIYSFHFLLIATINCVLLIPIIDLYRIIFPPFRLIEIYGEHTNQLVEKLNGIPYKYHIDKSISYEENNEELIGHIKQYDAVLINDLSAEKENKVIKLCFLLGKRVYYSPKISDILVRTAEELNLIDTPIYLNRNTGIGLGQRFCKRMFDIVSSGISLVLLLPLFLVVYIAIRLEDGGPAFYLQERVTLNNRHFMIYKFRSMIVDAEKDGKPRPAGEKDDRITKVGRIIRACRIDELPQLVNILKGDMSIVGPRPERWEHCEKYSREIPEWECRNKVRGGLTGYAQVYGKYNTTALDKLKLDLIYITNYSLLLDLQIIFETVKILFRKDSTEGFTKEKIAEMQGRNQGDTN